MACFIRVRNDLWWILNMGKRFQLIKTIPLSTINEIFEGKNIFFCGGRGGVKIIFLIILGLLTILLEMSHFCDRTYLKNNFHTYPWIRLVKAFFKYPYTSDDFCPKSGIFVLITYFFPFLFIFIFQFFQWSIKCDAPYTILEKLFQLCSKIYQKIFRGDVSSFSRKSQKNRQNQGFSR